MLRVDVFCLGAKGFCLCLLLLGIQHGSFLSVPVLWHARASVWFISICLLLCHVLLSVNLLQQLPQCRVCHCSASLFQVLSLLTLPNEFWAVSAQQRLPLLLQLLVLFFGLRLQCLVLCSIQT